jgi:2-keto-4-pentenoate hydratase/2-oxohepta-3-ene-1,7-dioic acid hydratase in catechol pathway
MQLITFTHHDVTEPGLLLGDNVLGLKASGFATLQDLIDQGEAALSRVAVLAHQPPPNALIPLANVKILTPLARPTKLICVGLNYRDHATECGAAIPKIPVIFSKFASAVIGPCDNIVLPKASAQPDYEAELVVVIGKKGRNIPKEKWAEYVFGYTNMDDVSARDVQMATSQWLMGKTFDTFAPIGPAIVTKDEIPDPNNLKIEHILNGEVMQSSNTSEMIFHIPYIIEHLSRVMTLEPGDLISTGTPAGVGMAKKPPRWLRPGDVAIVRIEGIPELSNGVKAE